MNARNEFVGVCAARCGRCLFSEYPLVPSFAVASMVSDILRRDSYFTCHEATARNVDAMCRGWWDEHREQTNPGRMAERLGIGPSWKPEGRPTQAAYAAELNELRHTDWGEFQ